MLKEDELRLSNMGELNNSIVALIDSSKCTTIEVITVLRNITFRLDKAFELSVMGNALASLADKARKNGEKEVA